MGGRIEKNDLVLGSWVEPGTVLVELDDAEVRLRLAQIQARRDARMMEAESIAAGIAAFEREGEAINRAGLATLTELQRRTDAARSRARHLREEAERSRRLVAVGGSTRSDADRRLVEAEEAEQLVAALEAQIERVRAEVERDMSTMARAKAELGRERASALADVRTLNAEAERALHELALLRLRAPIAGRVSDVRELRPGAVVAPGDTLALIVPHGAHQIVAHMPRGVLGRIRPGQSAELKLDAFPWAQYGTVPLRVVRVADAPAGTTFRVELEPTSDDVALLSHGLTGVVEIETERVRPLVLVLRAVAGAVDL